MIFSVVIVEDSVNSVNLLSNIIDNYLPQLKIVGKASSVEDAIISIETLQPDIVFLDIHLHGKTSFDLLNDLQEINFYIIFISAHEEYAIQAFQFEAVHYLVKPINPKDLIGAVNRIALRHNNKYLSKEELLSLLQHNDKYETNKISVSTIEGIRIIDISKIIYIVAEGNYSNIIQSDGSKIMVSKILKKLSEQIKSDRFYRVNKSYLINLDFVSLIRRSDGGTIRMDDGKEIVLSRRKKEDFFMKVSGIYD